MLFLFICANIPKITRYKYLIKTKSYNIGFESKIIKLLTLYSRIAQALFLSFSNLPNNSFTSIFAVFPSRRGVVTLQVQRCLRDLHGRTRSSLAVRRKIFPAMRGIFRRNLIRPNLYTEKPLKRNDRYDRKTHKKNVG